MAFDGTIVANLAYELNAILAGGRIQKIAQPEKDEILLTIKKERKNHRLLLSSGASLPLAYLIDENKLSPVTAPNFCMLLRKHLTSARILSIEQPELERILVIHLENLNELGDLTHKKLVVELMGKHSNIIFVDDKNTIVDSIKHVSVLVSSVREVLPGKEYFVPNTMHKSDPFTLTSEQFTQIMQKPMPIAKAIYTSITGMSPQIAVEICYRCQIDSDSSTASLSDKDILALWDIFVSLITHIKKHNFSPTVYFDNNIPVEFSCFPLQTMEHNKQKTFDSISHALLFFYHEKEVISRIRQKSTDLRKTITTLHDRDQKKYFLQQKQLRDTDKRDRYRVYGELIQTYGNTLTPEDTSLTCINYYDNKEVTIPIDNTLTPMENATKLFNRYNKLKRTYEALTIQMKEVKLEIDHLDSIMNSLEIARQEEDLVNIRQELVQCGYLRKSHEGKGKKKRRSAKSKPLHFLSSDGFDIFVGKNNFQNDELTFQIANGGDWWFHAKNMPGSHVIVRCPGGVEPPIQTFEEAGRLAAYFSKGKGAEKVEIDYTLKKNVKKPNGSNPGYVIYYTNYSLMSDSNIQGITCVDESDQIFLERSYL